MTDGPLRSARQLLAELQTTKTYLRVAAARVLPYAGVLGVERRAEQRCAELLEQLGVTLGFDPSEAEPVIVVRAITEAAAQPQPAQSRQHTSSNPRTRSTRSTAGPPTGSGRVGSGQVRGRAKPPARSAPKGRVRTLGTGRDDEDIDDAATVDGPSPGARRRRSASRASSAKASARKAPTKETASAPAKATPRASAASASPPGAARTSRATASQPPSAQAARASSRAPAEGTPEAAAPRASAASPEPPAARKAPPEPSASASLVSFDEPERDASPAYVSYDRDGAVQEDEPAAASEPKRARFSDVGADALVTLDEGAPDLGDALGSSILDDPGAELDYAPDPDAFEDEAATMVKPSPAESLYGGSQRSAGQGAQARASTARASSPASPAPSASPPKRVTSGLYGGSSVPTIRDSNDNSRPRAAAIQLNAGGTGGRVLGLEEEEEPIAVGEADEEYEAEAGGGFSLSLQEHEEDYDDYDDYEEEPEEQGGFEEEEALIAQAIPVPAGPTPEEIAATFASAQAAAAGGHLQQGAELYSDVIDADPDNVAAHVARGRLYLDLGDYSRAMSDFMVAEEIAADSPEPQVAIGDLYFARKDYRKAIEYFNAALDMSPNHAMAFCRRGISHYYRKNYQDALNDLLKAQRIQPDIPNIMTYVSMAKKKKGKR